ncbi:unnamed protein product [Amoebophrya sp. A120]|nr:unnamed protein product [Amoebophrya sp. A120]|eukprot:GSA120T00024640001.1
MTTQLDEPDPGDRGFGFLFFLAEGVVTHRPEDATDDENDSDQSSAAEKTFSEEESLFSNHKPGFSFGRLGNRNVLETDQELQPADVLVGDHVEDLSAYADRQAQRVPVEQLPIMNKARRALGRLRKDRAELQELMHLRKRRRGQPGSLGGSKDSSAAATVVVSSLTGPGIQGPSTHQLFYTEKDTALGAEGDESNLTAEEQAKKVNGGTTTAAKNAASSSSSKVVIDDRAETTTLLTNPYTDDAGDTGGSASSAARNFVNNVIPPSYYSNLQTSEERAHSTDILTKSVSFCEGLMEGQMLTIFYLFKDTYHLDPAPVGLLTAITHVPFVLKPWLAHWVDSRGDDEDAERAVKRDEEQKISLVDGTTGADRDENPAATALSAANNDLNSRKLQQRKLLLLSVNAISAIAHVVISAKHPAFSFFSLIAIRFGNCMSQTVAQALVITGTREKSTKEAMNGTSEVGQRERSSSSTAGQHLPAADNNPLSHNAAASAVSGFFYYRAVGALIAAYSSGALMHRGVAPSTLLNCMTMFPLSIVAATLILQNSFDDCVGAEDVSRQSSAAFARQYSEHMVNRGNSNGAPEGGLASGARTGVTSRDPTLQESEEIPDQLSIRSLASRMYHDRRVFLPAAFVMLYIFGPNYDDALNFFYINRLHWTPDFLGAIQLAHHTAKIVAMASYGLFLYQTPTKKLYQTCAVLSAVMFATPALITTGAYQYLHINPKFLALAGEVLRDSFGWLLMLPIFTDCVKRFAPPGREATTFAMVSFLPTVARFVNKLNSAMCVQLLGITATNFDHLTLFVFIVAGSTVLPALVVDLSELDKEETAVAGDERVMQVEYDVGHPLQSSRADKAGGFSSNSPSNRPQSPDSQIVELEDNSDLQVVGGTAGVVTGTEDDELSTFNFVRNNKSSARGGSQPAGGSQLGLPAMA